MEPLATGAPSPCGAENEPLRSVQAVHTKRRKTSLDFRRGEQYLLRCDRGGRRPGWSVAPPPTLLASLGGKHLRAFRDFREIGLWNVSPSRLLVSCGELVQNVERLAVSRCEIAKVKQSRYPADVDPQTQARSAREAANGA